MDEVTVGWWHQTVNLVLTASGVRFPPSTLRKVFHIMPFFTFRQNNSGGQFRGPAITVIIEADGAEEVNRMVEDEKISGMYFDGVENEEDCPCCGDRWCRQFGDNDGDAEPMIYGTPYMDWMSGNISHEKSYSKSDGVPILAIFYKSGEMQTY